MGCCFSSGSDYSHNRKPHANVISLTGDLRQYPLPATVSQVLHLENSSPDSVFLCNSDRLYFDDYIPYLHEEDELEQEQIYFVLPTSKLQHRLLASEMAALALKASVALEASACPRKKARISPVIVADEDYQSTHLIPINNNRYIQNKNGRKASMRSEFGISRPSSMRRLQRFSSRRAKLAVRSFKSGLTTINEGSVFSS